MKKDSTLTGSEIIQRREFVSRSRHEVRRRRLASESGISVARWFSDQVDALLRGIVESRLGAASREVSSQFSLIAVGGNGRQRPAPYSDVDVLFVVEPRSAAGIQQQVSAIVRDCWDAGLQLGHSVRTPSDVVRFALEDIQFATSLIQTRFVAGSAPLTEALQAHVQGRVFRDRGDRIIQRCVTARRDEWLARGNSVNQLEPDVKRSPGGLRDLHLLQWVTFLRHGSPSLTVLRNHGEISDDELTSLQTADEFLTALRLDLHSACDLKQDVLTRELQLKIAGHSDLSATDSVKAVESFMQEYFSQTSRVAEVARRVTEVPRRPSLLTRLRHALLAQRSDGGFSITDGVLTVPAEQLRLFERDPVRVMDVFASAAEHQVPLSADLRQFLGQTVTSLPPEPSRDVCRRFRDILRMNGGLPDALRAMYETGYLEWLIPQFAGIRCLIQFNQYHSFTVDEHTLKAMDEIVCFADDQSPVGSACRSVRHRATLHLALLMHDVGKGKEGDHSLTGAEMCEQVAVRLQMAENKKKMLIFLVRHHLVMPNLAFRRDTSDASVLVEFARLVGAPELLRMLYVLTVADIRAVGPDVWSDWKGELLADLYNRTMQILSGRPYNHLEQERLKVVRETVRSSIDPTATLATGAQSKVWIEQQLDALPPFYLMTQDPERIARDLNMIRQLNESEVRIEGEYEPDTHTVSYRVFAPDRHGRGSFHKVAGILSGLRMNILAAQICTTADSVVIASFRVTDNDFSGTVPASRVEDVAMAIGDVLTAKKTVESVFRRSSLFRVNRRNRLMTGAEPQVSIDNDCSERFTVIDVFASDSQGLLYTLAHTLFEHGLDVQQARISTHIDQVVDVFYVVDQNHGKLEDPERLKLLQSALLQEIRLLSAG